MLESLLARLWLPHTQAVHAHNACMYMHACACNVLGGGGRGWQNLSASARREGKEREGKGKGREGKGREGKGRRSDKGTLSITDRCVLSATARCTAVCKQCWCG